MLWKLLSNLGYIIKVKNQDNSKKSFRGKIVVLLLLFIIKNIGHKNIYTKK